MSSLTMCSVGDTSHQPSGRVFKAGHKHDELAAPLTKPAGNTVALVNNLTRATRLLARDYLKLPDRAEPGIQGDFPRVGALAAHS